jgi:hypothetical protein
MLCFLLGVLYGCLLKGKFVPALRHGGVLGSGCIDPRFLDLGTSLRWVVSFTPRPLYSRGKSSWYPVDRGLGGLQNLCGRRGERKFYRDSNFDPSVVQPVASRYTDCTTALNIFKLSFKENSEWLRLYIPIATNSIHWRCAHQKVALCWFLARFILQPWGWRRDVSLKRQLTFNGLHAVTSQKMEFFMTTAVRASDPTESSNFVMMT